MYGAKWSAFKSQRCNWIWGISTIECLIPCQGANLSNNRMGLVISRFANWVTQFSCCGNTSGTGPELRNPTKPRSPATPIGGGDKGPEVESDEEEEKKPKRLVVTALQDEKARALDRLVDNVIQELGNCPNGAIFDMDDDMNPGPQQNVESMCAVLRAIKGSVVAIVRGNDFAPAMLMGGEPAY
ncbi:hypothetical protein FCIRC_4207 [Fusarium circinatum]|uniref:Uncharacterized protein n=1 Tax=Fusarium circinatum TaxID=48490 RepID=A0A8H5U9W6_FUSCI|nr:hypothetical protein FCIRC_4207 [Fusarium circinatum]